MHSDFSPINKTRSKVPALPFVSMKEEILGKRYDLSVAFVGSTLMRKLNKKYRGKDKPTNVLSFSLDKNKGELILCPAVIKKETKKFGKSYKSLLGYLAIHGMLHLTGLDHGPLMDKMENKYLSIIEI